MHNLWTNRVSLSRPSTKHPSRKSFIDRVSLKQSYVVIEHDRPWIASSNEAHCMYHCMGSETLTWAGKRADPWPAGEDRYRQKGTSLIECLLSITSSKYAWTPCCPGFIRAQKNKWGYDLIHQSWETRITCSKSWNWIQSSIYMQHRRPIRFSHNSAVFVPQIRWTLEWISKGECSQPGYT